MDIQIQIPLALPPWTSLGKKMESALRKALFDFEMISGQNIALALSGGKDSLTLLFLLKAISGRGFPNFNLHAIHVSGEFSCGAGIEENFLKKICKALNIPLHICLASQKRESLECYSCSRIRRRLIFDKAKELNCSTIAFGHHRDDSAQTLLMNLFHKGEFAANLPKIHMHDFNVTLIRPLIYISEREIRNFAKMYGFSRITCQCPVGQNSMRKKMDQLMSDLEELFPNIRENISNAGILYGSRKAEKP